MMATYEDGKIKFVQTPNDPKSTVTTMIREREGEELVLVRLVSSFKCKYTNTRCSILHCDRNTTYDRSHIKHMYGLFKKKYPCKTYLQKLHKWQYVKK